MDCICNSYVPKSTSARIIIPPTGKTFVTGVASSYSTRYPEELKGVLTEKEFNEMIDEINDYIFTFWPCLFSLVLGYCCCPCTCGLSFLIPNLCVKEAEEAIINQITRANKERLLQKGWTMSLQKKCSTSWLQLERSDHESSFSTDNSYHTQGSLTTELVDTRTNTMH